MIERAYAHAEAGRWVQARITDLCGIGLVVFVAVIAWRLWQPADYAAGYLANVFWRP